MIHVICTNGWIEEEWADEEWDPIEGLNAVSESRALQPFSQEECWLFRVMVMIKSFSEDTNISYSIS